MMIPSKSSGIVTLYFFLILLHTFASPTFHYCRHDQRDALLEFKHEFNESDPNLYGPFLSSWNKSSDCCFWEGVTCDSKYGEVTSLFFDTISLNNSLKPNSSLFKLQHLRNLTLRNCNLYGEIPSSLTNLSRLSLLDLSYNYLLGQVPHSIGNLSHLTVLDLCNNKLVGQVPSSLGNLTQLRFMILSYNELSGNIPISFANLTKLYELNLKSNYLESTLPHDMSRFHNLEYFDVSQNSLTGTFPTSLFTIPSLISVDLELNHFMGPIEFGNMSSSSCRLQYINLAQNKFYGPIPESISQYLNLVELHLSFNNLNGLIPRSLSNLVKLEYFCLTNNKLQGQVPSWLWRLTMVALSNNSFNSLGKSSENLDETQVKWLDLSSNSFKEPFPIWICKLISLEILILSNNLFTGSIPPCLQNSTASLTDLILRNNSLSGVLPDIFVNATKLLSLDVSRNHLEGQLPRSLIHCTRLELVNVRSNKLKDKFPHWLGSLSSLHVLILRSNMFYGTLYHHHHHESIGFQSLRVIDISHNDFTGTLPSFYFTDWREMIRITEEDDNFVISDVPYMGKILNATAFYISSMEIVSKGVEMEFKRINEDYKNIDFSRNNLFGNIPESIGLLKELRHLNLSGNAFTGNIPQSLSNLTKLEALDLSRNQLSGQIPRDLGSLSFMSTMNFSHNFLEGPVPRSTQFQRQSCSSFKDNPKLYDLEDICGETHVPNPVLQDSDDLLEEEEEEEQVINWLSAAIAYVPGVFCGFVIAHIFTSHKHIKKFHRNKPKVFMQIAR